MTATEPTIVKTAYLASVCGITPQRANQLVKDGVFEKVGRNEFDLAKSVQAFIAHRVKDAESRQVSPANERLRAARAREIELRIAREDRRVIDLTEATDAFDQAAGIYISSIESFPARATRDRTLRKHLEDAVFAERHRVSERFGELRDQMRTGGK